MSSIFDISGNNLPEITSTSTPQELIQCFRILIARKRNEYTEPEQFAAGYNRAIEELITEIDKMELKQKFSANTAVIAEFNRHFKLTGS
jgi:hypothetical protein